MLDSAEPKFIGNVEAKIEAALQRLPTAELSAELEPLRLLAPPRGMRARVVLRHLREHRKIRTNANASHWDRDSGDCEASVRYEPAKAEEEPALAVARRGGELPLAAPAVLRDIVVALDAAEREPRFREFVGIKAFRDQFLLGRGYDWSVALPARGEALREAINQGIVLRSSVANPNSPQFPVTAIRLNREHPAVRTVLGETVREREFLPPPISIRGEPISASMLRERR